MAIVNANGAVQVLNTALLSVNGTTGIDVQDYITSMRWTSGSQSDHISTINGQAQSIAVNPINSRPSGSITFVAGTFPTFYQFLNNRNVPFSLQITMYTTGDLGGITQSVLLTNVLLDDIGGGVEAGNPANTNTFGFKCPSIQYL